jgi:uncharacterized tellurite resistance protein B-like protein
VRVYGNGVWLGLTPRPRPCKRLGRACLVGTRAVSRYPAAAMSQRDKAHDRLFCEIVAQLIIADAAVTDEERAFLERLMDRFGFDADDRRAVFGAVDIGQPIDDRLARLPEELRAELLAELEDAAVVDGDVGRGEAEIIEEVRRALGQ